MPMGKPAPVIKRFWPRVNKTRGCWIWTGARIADGYGQIWLNRKVIYTHRLSYELSFGKIPNGMNVLHDCDNPKCVRPSHLFLGTDLDNALDKASKGRCGLKGKRWKISNMIEVEIMSLIKIKVPQKDIAKKFNICLRSVRRIVASRKHISDGNLLE